MPPPSIEKDVKNTLGWLIGLYLRSRDWALLSTATRRQRGRIYEAMEKANGDVPLKLITRAKVEEGISARRQNEGRHFFDCYRGLFRWAIDNDLFDGRNPTDGIKIKRDNGDGHLAWPLEIIERFEAHWPRGTKERLLFDIFLYTGLRRGDVARLGRQHIKSGVISLMTEKSQERTPVFIPVHPDLAASIAACPNPNGLAIVSQADGTTPYDKVSIGNLFNNAIKAAGIPTTKRGSDTKGYSAHGLRKASATIAAESGASESELNAMYGWSGHSMAQLYTRKADRKKLAARAFSKWKRPTPGAETKGEVLQLSNA
jgi:integrase